GRALELDPKDKLVQGRLVELVSTKGSKDQTRDVLLRIEKSDPSAHGVQFRLAKLYLEEKDKDKAYEYLSRALKNQPGNPEYVRLLPSVITSDVQVGTHFTVLEGMARQPGAS